MSKEHVESPPMLKANVPAAPMQLHQGASGASVDLEKAIDDNGCVKQYYILEACLGQYDRSWSKVNGLLQTSDSPHVHSSSNLFLPPVPSRSEGPEIMQ